MYHFKNIKNSLQEIVLHNKKLEFLLSNCKTPLLTAKGEKALREIDEFSSFVNKKIERYNISINTILDKF